jgi:hypothetical protein
LSDLSKDLGTSERKLSSIKIIGIHKTYVLKLLQYLHSADLEIVTGKIYEASTCQVLSEAFPAPCYHSDVGYG